MKSIVKTLEIIISSILILISIKNLEMMFYPVEIKFFYIFFILFMLIISFLINPKYKKIKKLLHLLSIIANLIVFIYSILYKFELLEYFSSVTKLKNLILSCGAVGIIIFILLAMGQVILLPIPVIALVVCGSLIYGPFLTTIFCSLGVILGSFIAFTLGRVFGLKLVKMFISEKVILKYNDLMNSKGKLILSLAFIFPIIPDDVLCLMAGISNLKVKDFMLIVSTLRPISILFMCYFGGGKIIPFSGWGVYVWIIITMISLLIFIIYFKFRNKIKVCIEKNLKKNKNPSIE